MPVAITLYEVGNSSIFISLYLVMLFLVLDFGRLIHLVPKSFLHNSWSGTISVFVVILGLFIYGYQNYLHKERVELSLNTGGLMQHKHRVVMLTDLHLGYHNRTDEFRKWVDKVNAEKPEAILIAGDIIDGSIRALAEQGMAAEFNRLKAPVYACLGNHEYYSGELRAKEFYKEANIHLLIDDHALIPLEGGDTLLVVGRDDRTNMRRSGLKNLMKTVPRGYYTILLDHQPYHLEEAQQAGINFQLSGHTHHGQVWPISWIEDSIYEKAFGPLQKGNTQYYVSSGIGIWGGKFRIGTRSEYVVADIL
ncbi:metallophosphoesterase [Prevotella falsenii]